MNGELKIYMLIIKIHVYVESNTGISVEKVAFNWVNWKQKLLQSLVLIFSTFYVNPFHAIGLFLEPFLYPLITSENRKFFWCYQGVYRKGIVWWNGLIIYYVSKDCRYWLASMIKILANYVFFKWFAKF